MDIGFRLATGGVEALKPWGVALLQQVVVTFGKLEDPLLPGERQGLLHAYTRGCCYAFNIA